MNHIQYMKRALTLAEKGIIHVSPNPAVGAILVKDGIIIGEGFHKGKGHPHAEIEAIDNSTQSVKGATLYCTLEPCSTLYEGKKQTPCTNRIIQEKISTVVISMIDPNPFVNGKGIKKLEEAGIEVISGILEGDSKKLNEVFITNMTKSLPFVHLKIAQTIDGKVATESKNSQWITDDDARKDVHGLRSLYDSVLIGSGTAALDDPQLTIRYGIDKAICRIILDSKLKLSLHSRLLQNTQLNKTIIITGSDVDQNLIEPYLKKNVEVYKSSLNKTKQIDLIELLKKLFQLGICSILVEGGSEIFTSFIREQLFDKLTVYIAPKICGTGTSAVNDLGTKIMDDSLQLDRTSVKEINNQIVFTGYRA